MVILSPLTVVWLCVTIMIGVTSSCSRQLCVCLEQILKNDFPERWTAVVGQVHTFLSSDNQATWLGSLMALYQLSKKYK